MTLRSAVVSLAVALATAGCFGSAPAAPSPDGSAAPSVPAAGGAYAVSTVCLDATVPASSLVAPGGPIRIVGTLMQPSPQADALLVLLPGVDATRALFDSPFAGGSMQRYLAERGVASLAIDRPGMGESVFPKAIDLAQSDAVLAQVVAGVRSGSWHEGDGCEAPAIAPTFVALGGWSAGSLLTIHYASTDATLAGMLVLGGTTRGLGAKVAASLSFCIPLHTDPISLKSNFVCPEAQEPVATCAYTYAYEPTTDPAEVAAYCALEYAQPEGVVAREAGNLLAENRARLATMPPMPVHIVFYGNDWAVSNEGSEAQDRDDMVADMSLCCRVTHATVPETGHGFFLHPGQDVGYQSVVDWMRDVVTASPAAPSPAGSP